MTGIVAVLGDSREVLKTYEENSFDSCCTDPPYALVSIVKRFGGKNSAPAQQGSDGRYARASAGFMGQQWDTGETAFDPAFWAEVLRVLKPGAHLVAFSGTRTYHRMVVAIEDAGFEIRDQIGWLYGSGFPKSHDVSKGIDRAAGAERPIIRKGEPVKRMIPGADQNKDGWIKDNGREYIPTETEDATAAAAAWEGWGTALKPAWEPICLARKPLSEKTVAANVLRWGTGAINIDGCRIFHQTINGGNLADNPHLRGTKLRSAPVTSPFGREGDETPLTSQKGRWPANIVHDGSAEVLAAFPDAPGQQADESHTAPSSKTSNVYGAMARRGEASQDDANDGDVGFKMRPGARRGDSGTAARFFYTAKADADDRLGSGHPTVKPVDLMQWLIRLITPPVVYVCDTCHGGSYDSTKATGGVTPLRDVRSEIQADGQSSPAAVLLPDVRSESDGSDRAAAVQAMREDVQAGSGIAASAVLLSDLQEQGDSCEAAGLDDIGARLSSHLEAGPSSGDEVRLHNGTSARRGKYAGQTTAEIGGGASQERAEGGQPARESRSDAETPARQDSKTPSEADQVSALRREDRSVRSCPTCGGALTKRPSLVLEPFAGTGTTGEAAFREKMRCVMIEREPKFHADIERRISLMQSSQTERRRESIKAKIKDGRAKDDAGPLFGDRK